MTVIPPLSLNSTLTIVVNFKIPWQQQVMFSDGIRPGGDLTELDGSDSTHRPPKRSGSKGSSRKHRREHRDKTSVSTTGSSAGTVSERLIGVSI